MWEGEILTTESFSLRSPPFRPAELQRRRVGEAGSEESIPFLSGRVRVRTTRSTMDCTPGPGQFGARFSTL